MVYVALTVATFVAVLTCCLWFARQKQQKSPYTPVGAEEERVELTAKEQEHKMEDNSAFTLEDSDEDFNEVDEEVEIDLAAVAAV